MDYVTIIAQVIMTAAADPTGEKVVPLDLMWQQITSLGLVEALTFISFGTVCLFYGWRIFKILVTICFGLIGLLAGIWLNRFLIEGNVIWLSVMLIVLFAFLSIPLMRWGVSVLGAAAGGVITSGVWLAVGLPEQFIWAGALIGIIAGGMISFIIFKAAVMLFTSLGGSALLVVGILAVLYQYVGAKEKLQALVFDYGWFLPAALMVPMVAGMIMQYRFIGSAKDWDI